MTGDAAIEAELLRLVTERGVAKSICPSEVARALAENWQPLLGRVRTVAVRLSVEGKIDVLRKGKPVPPEEVRGVIRLRLRPDGPTDIPAEETPDETPE